jgi:hypothetical protein
MGFGGGLAVGLAIGSDTVTTAAAAPTVSVEEWSDLGALDVPDGYLVAVTGESGITSAIVQWDQSGGEWQVVDVVCTYAAHSAAEWAATAGEWYDTGGVTVTTADGARCVDTTYATAWRWSATASAWILPLVYAGTVVVSASPIYGDDAAPAGWTVTDTDGGGTASVTTDGTRITLSAVAGSASATTARLTYADASLSTGGNAFGRALITIPTQTQTGTSQVGARMFLGDGTHSVEYGGARLSGGSVVVGRFFNAVTYAAIAAQGNFSADTTTETLVEWVKIGARTAVRVGGGAGVWQSIANASARAAATAAWIFSTDASLTSGTASGSLTVRHGRFLRF